MGGAGVRTERVAHRFQPREKAMDHTLYMMDEAVTSLPVVSGFVVLWIGFAFGNGLLAKQLGHSVVLWVILSLIPIVNYFFYFFVVYATALGILKRLNLVADRFAAGNQTT
jgi:hypothetical protein